MHHKLTCRFQSAVQIHGRQNRFQSINQQRSLAAATALFLSPPQTQVVAQFKLLSDLNQMPFTDQVGAQLREFALAKLRETLKQLFTGDQRQHSVAQKLQLLIITDLIFGFCRLLRFLLARL